MNFSRQGVDPGHPSASATEDLNPWYVLCLRLSHKPKGAATIHQGAVLWTFFYISNIFLYLGNGRVQENVQTHGSKAITQMIILLSSLKYLHKRRFRFPDLINIFVYMNVSRLNPFDRWESVTKLSWTKIPLKWMSVPRVQIIMGVTWKLSRSMILDWQRTCQSWYWCQLLLRFPWMPTSSLPTSHSELEPQPDQPVKYWKGGGDKIQTSVLLSLDE